jgi:hypothetical protein
MTNAEASKKFAEIIGAVSRRVFDEAGSCDPKLCMACSDGILVITPNPLSDGQDVPGAMCELIYALGGLRQWIHIAAVSETWMKKAHVDDEAETERLANMPRGQLEKDQEHDPMIFTAVIVMVLCLIEIEASYFQTNEAHIEPEGVRWETDGWPGLPEGSMPQRLLAAMATAPTPPAQLATFPLVSVAAALIGTQMVSNATVMSLGGFT